MFETLSVSETSRVYQIKTKRIKVLKFCTDSENKGPYKLVIKWHTYWKIAAIFMLYENETFKVSH